MDWIDVDTPTLAHTLHQISLKGIASVDNIFVRRDKDKWTLLHELASGVKNLFEIRHLVERGFPVNVADHGGWTALHEAAQEGRLQTCQFLVEQGALCDIVSNDGFTPLMAAADVGNDLTTEWFLKQHNGWNYEWDWKLFKFLLENSPASLTTMLDVFALPLNHTKKGLVAVQYSQLRRLYGTPDTPITETPLDMILQSGDDMNLLSHRVIRHLLKAKWQGFARKTYRREFLIYFFLIIMFSIPNFFQVKNDSNVGSLLVCKIIAWCTAAYLLLHMERREFMGAGIREYFQSIWNWINFSTYALLMCTIPFEFMKSYDTEHSCLLAIVTILLSLNTLQFLQVSPSTGILVAMMEKMVWDVFRFLILYSAFHFGFAGAFYLLFHGNEGYTSFSDTFVTLYFLLFGEFNYDIFYKATGLKFFVGITTLMFYLLCVSLVLVNILIAMMASTYTEVMQTAEIQALKSHAASILRMEKSMTLPERTRAFQSLITTSPNTNRRSSSKPSSVRPEVHPPPSSEPGSESPKATTDASNVETTRPSEATKSIHSITPSKLSIANPLQLRTFGRKVKSISHAASALQGVQMLTGTIQKVNLKSIEDKLFAQSMFDEQENTASQTSSNKNAFTLKPLDDGIRYENPIVHHVQTEEMQKIKDQQMNLQHSVLELKTLLLEQQKLIKQVNQL